MAAIAVNIIWLKQSAYVCDCSCQVGVDLTSNFKTDRPNVGLTKQCWPDKWTWQCLCESVLRLQSQTITINVMKNCAHQYFTPRRHWCCHTSQRDLSAALREGGWFPHTSLLTQGSLTVTYAGEGRSVMGKICASAHISSVMLTWRPITSDTVRSPWQRCYDSCKTCRATTIMTNLKWPCAT